jgi:hypothetical protein
MFVYLKCQAAQIFALLEEQDYEQAAEADGVQRRK